MKTTYFLLATFILPLVSISQTGSSNINLQVAEKSELSRLNIGAFYSPEASYRILAIGKNGDQAQIQSIVAYRNEIETIKYGHTAGIRLNYLLSRRFAIESGLNYSTYGEKSKPVVLTEFNGQTSTEIGTFEYKNTYHFISLPVDLSYIFGSKRLRYVMTSGISLGLAIAETSSTRIEYTDGGTSTSSSSAFGTPNSFYKIVLNAQVSAGVQYQMTRQLSLRVAPVFRINATSITNAPIRGHYFNAGLETGLMWRIAH